MILTYYCPNTIGLAHPHHRLTRILDRTAPSPAHHPTLHRHTSDSSNSCSSCTIYPCSPPHAGCPIYTFVPTACTGTRERRLNGSALPLESCLPRLWFCRKITLSGHLPKSRALLLLPGLPHARLPRAHRLVLPPWSRPRPGSTVRLLDVLLVRARAGYAPARIISPGSAKAFPGAVLGHTRHGGAIPSR